MDWRDGWAEEVGVPFTKSNVHCIGRSIIDVVFRVIWPGREVVFVVWFGFGRGYVGQLGGEARSEKAKSRGDVSTLSSALSSSSGSTETQAPASRTKSGCDVDDIAGTALKSAVTAVFFIHELNLAYHIVAAAFVNPRLDSAGIVGHPTNTGEQDINTC